MLSLSCGLFLFLVRNTIIPSKYSVTVAAKVRNTCHKIDSPTWGFFFDLCLFTPSLIHIEEFWRTSSFSLF